MKYAFTKQSSNVKTGPIPVTMSARETCPDNCGLKGSGCYAESGPVAIWWSRVSDEEHAYGVSESELLQNIKALPDGQLWRHNAAGDLKHDSQTIDADFLRALIDANRGRQGFTYTHHRVTGDDAIASVNRALIKGANLHGFTVNLSADNIAQADTLHALNIGPVVCIMPEDCAKVTTTPAGNTIVQCPATYRNDVQCSNCGICQVASRKSIIGFPVHGTGKKKAHKVFMMHKG